MASDPDEFDLNSLSIDTLRTVACFQNEIEHLVDTLLLEAMEMRLTNQLADMLNRKFGGIQFAQAK